MQNILELIESLMSKTTVKSEHVSVYTRAILDLMQEEYVSLNESQDTNKQKKMISLFMGGVVLALYKEDLKCHYQTNDVWIKLYPNHDLIAALRKAHTVAEFSVEEMYLVGDKLLDLLAQNEVADQFNNNLFKIEITLNGVNEPVTFFPLLTAAPEEVDLLLEFCKTYSDDLECEEMNARQVTASVTTGGHNLFPTATTNTEDAELIYLLRLFRADL